MVVPTNIDIDELTRVSHLTKQSKANKRKSASDPTPRNNEVISGLHQKHSRNRLLLLYSFVSVLGQSPKNYEDAGGGLLGTGTWC